MILVSALLMAALFCPGARATSAQDAPSRPLTDADVARIIPLLKANISELQAMRVSVSNGAQLIAATDEAMTNRTLDPLPWLKEHGQDIVVPPTARYDSSCSKSASRFHSIPTAVFTLGIAAEDAQRATTALQAARSFYQSRGFQHSKSLSAYGLGEDWVYFQKDGTENLVLAGNYLTVGEKLAGCESMPTGPMIARHLHIRMGDASAVTHSQVLDNALSAAGMSREDYDLAVSALTVARGDAGYSDALDGLESRLPQMSGAEKARYRAFIDVSKANIAVFRAHATELEPLLAELMGRVP
jgi:hypothetical protein